MSEEVSEDKIETSFKIYEWSGWECELFEAGGGLMLRPEKGKVPNWFWRTMQYLLLGNKWTKVK